MKLIGRFLSFYNSLYQIDPTHNKAIINQAYDLMGDLESNLNDAYQRITSDYNDEMLDISELISHKNHEDIYANMDCTDISTTYEEFKEPLCEYV